MQYDVLLVLNFIKILLGSPTPLLMLECLAARRLDLCNLANN